MTDDRYRITGDVVLDTTTGLEWQREHSLPMMWQQAMDYASALRLGGHSDWRVPTIAELLLLVDHDRVNPASGFPCASCEWFWSSSSYAGGASLAWYVAFNSGYVYVNAKTYPYYVRCVRRRGGALGPSDLGRLDAINDCADLRAAHRRAHDAEAALSRMRGDLAAAEQAVREVLSQVETALTPPDDAAPEAKEG